MFIKINKVLTDIIVQIALKTSNPVKSDWLKKINVTILKNNFGMVSDTIGLSSTFAFLYP